MVAVGEPTDDEGGLLGNAVQVQCAELVGLAVRELLEVTA